MLGILLAGGVRCGGGIGAAAWWFKKNEGAFKATGERAKADAEAFAKPSDEAGCTAEALRRQKEKSGVMEEVEHRVFFSECLKLAPKTPGFCDGAPKPDEIMKAATWARDQCETYDVAKESCGRMMQEVLKHCSG